MNSKNLEMLNTYIKNNLIIKSLTITYFNIGNIRSDIKIGIDDKANNTYNS